MSEGSGHLILPSRVMQEMAQERIEQALELTCPAAEKLRFADTNRVAVRCGVNGDAFAAQDAPQAVLAFCGGEYTSCPIWQASVDRDPVIERERRAREAARRKEITERQIASGLRVDDRGDDIIVPE